MTSQPATELTRQQQLKHFLRRLLPAAPWAFGMASYRMGCIFAAKQTEDNDTFRAFLRDETLPLSTAQRLKLLWQINIISLRTDCLHTETDVMPFVSHILRTGAQADGVFVEAGCFEGGSSAKFSLAARLVGRKLIVMDSFSGLPDNDEEHGQNIYGEDTVFTAGQYTGALEVVRRNVEQFGAIECCEFVKGWFDDTMPRFHEPLLGAFLDVDLVSSTRTCLRYLYPQLVDGGAIYSHDGHLPLVLALFDDETFWAEEVGASRPVIDGFGTVKVVRIAAGAMKSGAMKSGGTKIGAICPGGARAP